MAGERGPKVKFLYFAWVREKIGVPREDLYLPLEVKTVADAIAWLSSRGSQYAEAFARPHIIRTAIDHAHVKADAPVAGAREIAFFPPVTGG